MEQDSDMALTHKELADSSNQWRIQGYLRPLTSHGTRRYDTIKFVTKSSMEIPPGLFSKPQPEPAYCLENGWTAHTHPEGNLYFSRSGDLNVVTSAFLYDPWTLQTATAWIQRIHTMLLESQVVLTADMELFIELEDNDCGYYLVDHSNRTQFWLEPCNTETLELPEVASMLQLSAGSVLEWLYWAHVEYFPSTVTPLSIEKLDQLGSVFAHSLCDQMTSSVSTFGYSAKECGSFLNVLQVCRNTLDSKETTCVIARLWGTVYHQRIWNHYGEEQARLSRDQRILYHAGDSEASRSSRCFFVLANALTLGNFRTHAARLDDVFADDLVNSVQWPIFVLRNLEDWKREGAVASLWLTLHFPFLFLRPPSYPLLATSAFLLGLSATTSVSFYTKFKSMERFSADQARDYLCAIELGSFRFALVALVFALPKALCVWGASTLLVNYMLLIARLFGAKIALLLSGGLLFYCIIVYIVITGGAYSGVVRLVQGSPQYETEIV